MYGYRVHLRPFGFTMVEMVVVIVVLGIVSAIGVGRFMGRSDLDARAYADQMRSVLRFAQKTAIAQRRNIHIISDANKIAACYTAACGAGDLVWAPGGHNSQSSATQAACGNAAWLCEGRPSSATANSSFGAFLFNSSGATNLAADASVQISGNGGVQTVTVVAGTGYVY
ncbi:GspH/FimT family pseudopilin [Massilia sp. SM-13]|uniref:GspH/FimT family pseudopilin n=1 Tax=Pseudoduganella rhizocola TaxID=3382643 RepID=UPI0038B688E3